MGGKKKVRGKGILEAIIGPRPCKVCKKLFVPKRPDVPSTARYCRKACMAKAAWAKAKVARKAKGSLDRPLLWATAEEERARREKVALQLIDDGVPLSAIKERMGFDVDGLAIANGRPRQRNWCLVPFGPPAR
ncbi:hypothetical protein [Myxococcus landrumensis]|uniref:Uncharacterized protein n=1 Tax=Myxococcus landrumensis TaxID=2813577 RepID=A0ABX7N8T6_9BACT|nr:hypothetical protein [Myxococcus landrumus]QSQ14062.1 hypothetical protein JY572_38070 [Myxococcus landrumus]